jgi:O-antigen/teichoic acid export membrane protein
MVRLNKDYARIASDMLALVTARVFELILRFASVAIITHGLATDHQDVYFYLYNVAMFFSYFSFFGMQTTLFIIAGEAIDKEGSGFFRSVLGYRLILGGVVVIGCALWSLTYVGMAQAGALAAVLLFALYAANGPTADPFLLLLRGRKRVTHENILRLCEMALAVALLAVATTDPTNLPLFAGAWLAASLWRVVVSGVLAHRELGSLGIDCDRKRLRAFFRAAIAPGTSLVLQAFLLRAPVLSAPLFATSESLALLTIALMLSQVTQIVSSSAAWYALPRIRRPAGYTPQWRRNYIMAFSAMAAFGWLFFALCMLFRPILGLVFNMDFSSVHSTFEVIILSTPLVLINDFMLYYLVWVEKPKQYTVMQICAAVIYCVSLVVLSLADVAGAASRSYLISQLVLAATGLFLALPRPAKTAGD